MADSFKRHARRVEGIRDEIRRQLGLAALRGASAITTRAKEIVKEKGHVVTGALGRSLTEQLGEVSRTSAVALIGSNMVYARAIENLPQTGRRMPVTYYYRGKLVRKPGRGEGGGYLFPAAVEKTPEALRIAGATIESAMKKGSQ